jgi:pimeloyl-ACP methyl ester carboxylesterase
MAEPFAKSATLVTPQRCMPNACLLPLTLDYCCIRLLGGEDARRTRMSTKAKKIQTSHGGVAVTAVGDGHPVVFIHGNSACQAVFRKQLAVLSPTDYRVVSLDLPGHGASDNAADPYRSYTRPGLAECVLEVMEKLQIRAATVVGASLGGQIAIEMLARSSVVRSLFLMGTPAVGSDMASGFAPSPALQLASRRQLRVSEAESFAGAVFGPSFEPFMRRAVERTDRRFRVTLLASARAGVGVDQRAALASIDIPVAVANGERDPFVDLADVDSVPYANLWRRQCFRIPSASHSPYWDAPEAINTLLTDFLREVRAIQAASSADAMAVRDTLPDWSSAAVEPCAATPVVAPLK